MLVGVSIACYHQYPALLVAPAVAAGYYLYRSRRSDRPTRDVYRLGVEALAQHDYGTAIKHLAPLAQANDTRALFALGRLYATAAGGALRNEPEALRLYTRAAERDHAEAQYALGAFYADGRGVAANPLKAAEWYEQAATRGIAEAANSLGRLYENSIGVSADREKAIEWYYRAAEDRPPRRRRGRHPPPGQPRAPIPSRARPRDPAAADAGAG